MNLKNHFLIATPTLDDPLFHQSVVYIFEHSAAGTLGLIINKPIDHLTIQSALIELDIAPYAICKTLNETLFLGGPVNEHQGYILHSPINEHEEASVVLSNELRISTSYELLTLIGAHEQPNNMLFLLGHAGWGPTQLEKEIQRNDWLVAPADATILFHTQPEERWLAAGKLLGINLHRLSHHATRSIWPH